MCVPQIGQFFRVRPQNWQEWLFALAVGFGSIIVALLTKLLSRCALPSYAQHVCCTVTAFD